MRLKNMTMTFYASVFAMVICAFFYVDGRGTNEPVKNVTNEEGFRPGGKTPESLKYPPFIKGIPSEHSNEG